MTPFFNDTKKIISVTSDRKFFNPAQTIMINKDQGRKEGIEISRVSPSGEPNPMVYHRNTLIYSDEGRSKSSKPDHTKHISLVTPEDKFLCHAQVITTSRDQGRKCGLDISRISTYYDSNIIY